MHIRLHPVDYKELTEGAVMTSAEMKDVIEQARERQRVRYKSTEITLNSQLTGSMTEEFAALDKEGKKLLAAAYDRMKLNPRTVLRIRKLARTIADIEGSEQVEAGHLAEALQYRESLGGQ